ncbi:MAG: G8 domain-containing protein [Phycisphaerales bacterium]
MSTPTKQPRRLTNKSDQRPSLDLLEPRLALSTSIWTGAGGDGLWSNPSNWTDNQTPAYGADVVIDSGNAVVLDQGTPVVGSLALGGRLVVNRDTTLNVDGPFDLSSNADLRINGLVNWVDGQWATGAGAVVNPGGRLNIGRTSNPAAGSVAIDTDLVNLGRLAWRGGDLIVNGSLTNATAKMFDAAAPMAMLGEGRFINNGLFRRGGSATATTTIDLDTDNTDRMYVLRGTLALGDTDPDVPSMTNFRGTLATLAPNAGVISRAPTIHRDARFVGRGEFLFTTSTQIFRGDTTFTNATFNDTASLYVSSAGARFLGDVALNGNQIVVEGDLVIAGSVELNGATLTGTFDLLVADVLTLNNAAVDADVQVYSGGALVVSGQSSVGGNLASAGLISLGTGSLNIGGSLTTTGILETSIASSGSGTITATGPATLGGTLRAVFVGTGFASGGNYVVVTSSSRTGSFGAFQPLSVPSGLNAGMLYTFGAASVQLA